REAPRSLVAFPRKCRERRVRRDVRKHVIPGEDGVLAPEAITDRADGVTRRVNAVEGDADIESLAVGDRPIRRDRALEVRVRFGKREKRLDGVFGYPHRAQESVEERLFVLELAGRGRETLDRVLVGDDARIRLVGEPP